MAGFAPAVKSQAKARIGLYGVGGSGKTMAALLIARGLAPGGKYALVDCEAGKSSVYADVFPFDTIILPAPYTATRFQWCIAQAVQGGYDVLIVDGISPFWSGTGGVLAVVDAAKKRGGGWSDGSPEQQKIVDAILGAPLHVIVTMRAKSDTLVDKVDGKTTIRKVGMKYDQRDNLEYDLGWLLYLEHGTHVMTVEKTTMLGQENASYAPLAGVDEQPAEEFGKEIAAWLGSGAPLPEPAPAPEPPPPAAESPSPEPAPAPEPPAPAAAPEPVSAPDSAPSAPPEPPAPPAEAPAPAAAPPAAHLDAKQLAEIRLKLVELKTEKPESEWEATILGKVREWYGAESFEALAAEQAAQLVERLTTTLLKVRKANAEGAAA